MMTLAYPQLQLHLLLHTSEPLNLNADFQYSFFFFFLFLSYFFRVVQKTGRFGSRLKHISDLTHVLGEAIRWQALRTQWSTRQRQCPCGTNIPFEGLSIWLTEAPTERQSQRINGKVNSFKGPECLHLLKMGIKVKREWKLRTREMSFGKPPSEA